MIIQLENIYIKNFLSFGEANIKLNIPGYTLVTGKNNNKVDLASSNGSGKSSIFEAIIWALCGETLRGSKHVVNLKSDEGACVELSFKVDDVSYIIKRQKGIRQQETSLHFIVNNEDKSGKGVRDTQNTINSYLPDLTLSLIASVIILGQGLPLKFSNNTPSGRKEVLEKLSRSDFMIQDLKERISIRKDFLNSSLRETEDLILKETTEENILTTTIKTLNEKYSNLLDVSSCKDILEKNRIIKEQESNNLINYNTKREDEVNSLLSFKSQLDKLSIDMENEINSDSLQYDEKLKDLNNLKFSLHGELNAVKDEIIKINNIKDICPTCGQKLIGVVKPSTKDKEERILELDEQLNDISIEMNVLFDKKSDIINDIKLKYANKISILKENIKDKEKNIFEIDSDIKKCNQLIHSADINIVKYEEMINSLNQQKETLIKEIKETEQKLNDLKTDLLYINNKREDIKQHLNVISKMNTIVTREFRGYLLSSIIDFINKKAKEYSMDVFNTDKINFELEGNNISISYDDKDYSNLSGGEKQKVDLIVQFAIRDMLCKYLNFSSNILAVDELFDNLDSIGCERILTLISTKLHDVESIYIITHHSDIEIPVDNIITVTKGVDGISYVSQI